tara:strand:- start:413 stop:985 length:573 start_codon:yes stop_codon:yes gene_type:complete
MPMNIGSIRLQQALEASVDSTGLQSSITVGGSSSTELTVDDADIIYGFSMKSGHADNEVKWTLDTHKLSFTAGTDHDTNLTCTESVGASGSPADILDANGESITTAVTALAIYYEISALTTTGAWVMATSESTDEASKFATVKLVGHTTASAGVRSALLVPRAACASDSVTFTFSASDVRINVVYLANTS